MTSSAIANRLKRSFLLMSPFRIISLAIPPFLVVHTNSAYNEFVGMQSSEVLGKPLHQCLGRGWSDQLCSSVTTLHDRLMPIAVKSANQNDFLHCLVNVSCVGPEISDLALTEDGLVGREDDSSSLEGDDTARFVTHYCIELEPTTSGKNTCVPANGIPLRVVVSPKPQASPFCGVLG